MRTHSRNEFIDEVTRHALRHAAEYGVCVSCKPSSFNPNNLGVAIVDSQGRVVSPTSAISVQFSYGSTGNELVSTNGSRRGELNDNSLTTAKIEVRRLFERVCNKC